MLVERPDLEAWLCAYLRARLREAGVDAQVGNKEPADLGKRLPLARPLVVVRDDGGQRQSHVTFSHQVGVSVLAGTRSRDGEASRIARLVFGLLTDPDLALVDGPVCGVDWGSSSGPYAVVEDHDVARRYMVAGLVTVGGWQGAGA